MHRGWEQSEPPAEEGEARAVTCPLGLTFQARTYAASALAETARGQHSSAAVRGSPGITAPVWLGNTGTFISVGTHRNYTTIV